MSKFLSGVGMCCVSIASTILRGYTLSVIWAWFIVTTFQAPTINIPSAIGSEHSCSTANKVTQPCKQ